MLPYEHETRAAKCSVSQLLSGLRQLNRTEIVVRNLDMYCGAQR
jgi:hypothetical protein